MNMKSIAPYMLAGALASPVAAHAQHDAWKNDSKALYIESGSLNKSYGATSADAARQTEALSDLAKLAPYMNCNIQQPLKQNDFHGVLVNLEQCIADGKFAKPMSQHYTSEAGAIPQMGTVISVTNGPVAGYKIAVAAAVIAVGGYALTKSGGSSGAVAAPVRVGPAPPI